LPSALKVHTVLALLTGGPESPQATKPFHVPTMLVAFDIDVLPFCISRYFSPDIRRMAAPLNTLSDLCVSPGGRLPQDVKPRRVAWNGRQPYWASPCTKTVDYYL